MAVTIPQDAVSQKFTTTGSIISGILPYILWVAGISMMFMLISGGLTLMTAAGDQGKTKEGYGKLSAGMIGFLIVIMAYFVTQIVELVLGIKIL
ncbi:hypothetical protein KBC75_01795 [Candidatus Shapirobacteria bacterium]|nr:hypothetical protein [Candidatus Shapirobacteria bacterium]